jgi:TIR domain.
MKENDSTPLQTPLIRKMNEAYKKQQSKKALTDYRQKQLKENPTVQNNFLILKSDMSVLKESVDTDFSSKVYGNWPAYVKRFNKLSKKVYELGILDDEVEIKDVPPGGLSTIFGVGGGTNEEKAKFSEISSSISMLLGRMQHYGASLDVTATAAKTSIETIEIPLVFISYDTRDIELVHHIDSILKRVFEKRILTFIAQRDIKAGQAAFHRMLQDSLAKSKIVLALCTKRSLTSPWLWFESGAGFGRGDMIPMLWGVTPEQIKPPMNIFQGRMLDNKSHVEQLLSRVAEITGIEANISVTDEEFNKLMDICRRLDSLTERSESTRVEDIVEYPFSSPPNQNSIQYLIEAEFPLQKGIPKQRLLKTIEKCRITVPGTQAKFSYTFPDTELKPNPTGKDSALFINAYLSNPAINITDQQVLAISNSIKLTHWFRQFRLGTLAIVDGNEVNQAAAIAFTFFKKLGKELGFSTFTMRIRLFNLQNAQLNTGLFFERDISSYRAPASNDVEVSHEISNPTENEDFIDLMMRVWENFENPNGKMPALSEVRYKGTLKILAAEGKA